MRKTIRNFYRFFSRCRFLLKIFILKLIGIDIDWSAKIHWSATLEPSGGKIKIGSGTGIDKGVILRAYGGSIVIGSNCSINPYSVIYGDGGLTIGNGVRIAAHTVIVPANHIFSDPDKYIFEQGESCLGITIDNDVWLGAGVQVLDGVHVGTGSVIGAGSVVTKSTIPYGVYVGVPAKIISSRKTTD